MLLIMTAYNRTDSFFINVSIAKKRKINYNSSMETQKNELINLPAALERLDNDKDLYKILIHAFLYEKPFDSSTFQVLAASAMKGDETAAVKAAGLAHYVKGAASQLGADLLAEKARQTEYTLKGKESGDIQTLCQELLSLYEQTIDALKALDE